MTITRSFARSERIIFPTLAHESSSVLGTNRDRLGIGGGFVLCVVTETVLISAIRTMSSHKFDYSTHCRCAAEGYIFQPL